ncbi:hypothetical protein L209DRAFT_758638 [Thermothelomyces heterothallicus CBS 203.75]
MRGEKFIRLVELQVSPAPPAATDSSPWPDPSRYPTIQGSSQITGGLPGIKWIRKSVTCATDPGFGFCTTLVLMGAGEKEEMKNGNQKKRKISRKEGRKKERKKERYRRFT